MLPGPYCSMMLGDLGAEVIKIEDTHIGDPIRLSSSEAFNQINRNKKSIALDLKRAEGRSIFLKLVETSDVVLEQFRPGVVDRLGIGYDSASKANPQIIYCSLTGYGQQGPYRGRAGHDINYIALSGILGLTTDDRGKPVIPGVQIADLVGGIMAALAILAALIARNMTGQGQYIDVSMLDCARSLLPIPAAQHFSGKGPKLLSGAQPFYNVYETADGRFMSLGALEPKFWENFCRRIGRQDLIPRQFDEGQRQEELFEELRRIFKSRTLGQWVELMRDADACCEPVLSLQEALQGEIVPGAIRQIEGTELLGFAFKLSKTPMSIRGLAPQLGQHTDQLLAELGFSEAERERLRRAGIVRCAAH
jgi:crotonobetainyl-CoA:carnitine CoA-transferase CaiB-like acyl-CoA transferase